MSATAGQQDRHGNHRAQLRRNSVHQLEAGQHFGVAEMGHPKIDDADGDVGRRQAERAPRWPPREAARDPAAPRRVPSPRSSRCSEASDAAGVSENARGARASRQALTPRRAVPEFAFQLGPPGRYQVVAGFVRVLRLWCARVPRRRALGALRQIRARARHLDLRAARAARNIFDRVPIKVAGRKVECGERTALAQSIRRRD